MWYVSLIFVSRCQPRLGNMLSRLLIFGVSHDDGIKREGFLGCDHV